MLLRYPLYLDCKVNKKKPLQIKHFSGDDSWMKWDKDKRGILPILSVLCPHVVSYSLKIKRKDEYKHLLKCARIKYLELAYPIPGASGLPNFVSRLTRLRKLSLTFYTLPTSSLVEIVKVLGKCKKLTSFTLTVDRLAQDSPIIDPDPGYFPTLSNLDLTLDNCTPQLGHFFLDHCNVLRSLTLQGQFHFFNDAFLADLTKKNPLKMLSELSFVKTYDIWEDSGGPVSLDVWKMISTLPSLCRLDVTGLLLPQEEVAVLRKRLLTANVSCLIRELCPVDRLARGKFCVPLRVMYR